MTEVRYVWHDCFVVSMPQASLVFDFWVDEQGENRMPSAVAELDRSVPLFVFISHFHKDHYNPAVFGWAAEFKDVRYIVSRDVWKRMKHIISPTSVYSGPKVDPSLVLPMRPGDSHDFGAVSVTAFDSTDTGNSYAVSTGGRIIFHAGDLNAWIWKDESTEAEISKAMGDYRKILGQIEEWLGAGPIDIAFFPVDSRIGTDWWTGAHEFVARIRVGVFFPMHFALGDATERARRRLDALRFDLYANPTHGEYVGLTAPGDRWRRAEERNL